MKLNNNTVNFDQSAKTTASTTYGENVATNGGMETWSDPNTLIGYNFAVFSGAVTFNQDDTNPQAGTYCASMVGTYTDTQLIGYFDNVTTGLTPASSVRTSIYIRYNSGSASSIFMTLLNDVFASATEVYNLMGASAGTWTAFTGDIQNDHKYMITPNGTFANFTKDAIVPANGKVSVFVAVDSTNSSFDVGFDTLSVQAGTTTAANQVTVTDFANPSDASLFEATDYFLRSRTTGGTPKNGLSLNGLGAYSTDFDTYNFASKPVAVGAPTGATHAVTQQTAESLVAAVGSIDLKNTGQTTLYTVPAGYKFYPTKAYIEYTAKDTWSVDATISVGIVGGSYNDLISGLTSLVQPTANTRVDITSNFVTPLKSFASADVIKLDVDTGATATTLTGKIYLFGFLVAN